MSQNRRRSFFEEFPRDLLQHFIENALLEIDIESINAFCQYLSEVFTGWNVYEFLIERMTSSCQCPISLIQFFRLLPRRELIGFLRKFRGITFSLNQNHSSGFNLKYLTPKKRQIKIDVLSYSSDKHLSIENGIIDILGKNIDACFRIINNQVSTNGRILHEKKTVTEAYFMGNLLSSVYAYTLDELCDELESAQNPRTQTYEYHDVTYRLDRPLFN